MTAAKRAHNLEITRTLELEDLSGTKMLTNGEVRRVLDDLSRADVDGVCISAIDRLVRPGELGDLAIFDFFQRSKKRIWTPTQELDLGTNSGFLTSGIMGVIAGFERQLILQRTSQGKEISRQRGGNPNGAAVLPRGLGFDRKRGYFYVEPDASLIRRAYDLLFEHRSWHDIADRLGNGWSYHGVSNTLKNPIWRGARTYTEGRDEPLEVQVIEEPLISPERWQAAQRLIGEKRTRWKQTKRERPAAFLAGLLRCGCGEPVYTRYGQSGSYYQCSTHVRRNGLKCGSGSVRQAHLDATVERIVTAHLLDRTFLSGVLDLALAAAAVPAAPDHLRDRERLTAKRKRVLETFEDGLITRDELREKVRRIDSDLGKIETPAPVAQIDGRRLAQAIVDTFASFRHLALDDRRELLRRAVPEILVRDGAIPQLTLSGGFLGAISAGAKVDPRSRASDQFCTPDLTLVFPVPLEIAA